jgi:hypothetical protein
VSGWLLPGAVTAFWAGLVAWTAHPSWFRPWMGAAIGVAGLLAALIAAPGTRRHPSPLERVGLVEGDVPAIDAVAAPPASGC